MRRTCPSCHGPSATPVGRRGSPDSAHRGRQYDAPADAEVGV